MKPNEEPLPPLEDRIDIAQAAYLLGKSVKAVQQLVSRGSIRHAREIRPGNQRASFVWLTEAWVREYQEGRTPTPDTTTESNERSRFSPAQIWQELAERQAVEIIHLQAEVTWLRRAFEVVTTREGAA